MKKIRVYTKDHCPYCDRAKALLSSKKIAFEEIHLTPDRPEQIEALMNETQHRTVPQIFIDGNFIGGYSELLRLEEEGKLEELKSAEDD